MSWPDAGLNGSAQTIVDLSGPDLTVTWPAAPARPQFPGGLDFRDPLDPITGPSSWRRHDVIPVRVESASADLLASSLELRIAGSSWVGQLSGCEADGGFSDAGFCRIAQVPLAATALSGLRGDWAVTAQVTDDLGNQTTSDAGRLVVSRWAWSFDGGSAVNGFSMSRAGWLVVPNTPSSNLTVIETTGSPGGSVGTRRPPVRNVALGSDTPELIFALESNGAVSVGETYELPLLSQSIWAEGRARERIQTMGPLLAGKPGQDSVAAVFQSLGGLSAEWAVVANGGVLSTGQVAMGPVLARDAGTSPFGSSLGAVAAGSVITATDGVSFFSLAGTGTRSFGDLTADPKALPLAAPFTEVSHLIGKASGVAGSGLSNGMPRSFAAQLPGPFTPWDNAAPGPIGAPVATANALYFVRDGGLSSFVCRTTPVTGSTTCATAAVNERASGLALGLNDTLYAVVSRTPANATFLQVRTASTLALQYEIPLPGVTGACLSLTPTCIGGRPVIGCVDTVGRIVFVFTDARGIDTAADWPMEGHDPAKTFNTATALIQYSCP